MATCIGCGRRPVKNPKTYCATCKYRVAHGITVDLDDVPSQVECRRAQKAMDVYLRTICVTT